MRTLRRSECSILPLVLKGKWYDMIASGEKREEYRDAVDIRLHLEPEPPRVTHQQHRVAVVDGKPRFFDGPALRNARGLLMAHLEKFRPDAPLEGPLHMKTVWFFRSPARGKDGWKSTKPDTDNLQKLLKDCLTASGYWLDDAQVCHEEILKCQANEAAWHGIVIRIEAIR